MNPGQLHERGPVSVTLSSATAAEALKLVKAKIGLRDSAEGYAVYEVLGQQEAQRTDVSATVQHLNPPVYV